MTEKEKLAFTNGFSAAWEYNLGAKIEPKNPYDYESESDLYYAWHEGFDSYKDGR